MAGSLINSESCVPFVSKILGSGTKATEIYGMCQSDTAVTI